MCETIEKSAFQADTKKPDCCSRCAPKRSPYREQYCAENLQHLGPRDPAISNLTWYESLLVARVHPVISVVTLLATGQLCFAGHVCNYFVKCFDWLRELPNLLRDKKWFLVKRRKSLRAPAQSTRQKKPTTANRERLVAAFARLTKMMPTVYKGSYRCESSLAQFPTGEEVEMQPEEITPELAGQVHVERGLFSAWLDGAGPRVAAGAAVDTALEPRGQGAYECGRALIFFAANAQREDMRGAATGDAAFEVCYRHMYQKDLPSTASPTMGTQDLANFVAWLMEDGQLPEDVVVAIRAGALEELRARGKTIQTQQDEEEMWIRWVKQRIHEELDSVRQALDLPEELDVFASVLEGEQHSISAEAEQAARGLKASLGWADSGVETAEEQRSRQLWEEWQEEEWQEEGWQEAEEWQEEEVVDTDQEQGCDGTVAGEREPHVAAAREAGLHAATGQGPADAAASHGRGDAAGGAATDHQRGDATGHEREDAATGHEQGDAGTGLERGDAATGHERARPEAEACADAAAGQEGAVRPARSAAMGRSACDMPLVDPPEIDAEGRIRDTDQLPHWIPGAFPTIFQNETGDPYNYKLAKPDLDTWGRHILRSRGWAAQAHMTFMYWWMNTCQRVKALGAKKWFVKDNPHASGYTAEDLKRMSVPLLARKMVGYTKKSPGPERARFVCGRSF